MNSIAWYSIIYANTIEVQLFARRWSGTLFCLQIELIKWNEMQLNVLHQTMIIIIIAIVASTLKKIATINYFFFQLHVMYNSHTMGIIWEFVRCLSLSLSLCPSIWLSVHFSLYPWHIFTLLFAFDIAFVLLWFIYFFSSLFLQLFSCSTHVFLAYKILHRSAAVICVCN